jgi:hypothetical protein
MFTWICPQCGREVPPAYTECPDCTKKAAEGAAANPPVPPPGAGAQPPAYPQAYPPAMAPQQQPAPQYYQQQPGPPQYQQPGPPQYQQAPPQYQGTPPAYSPAPPPAGYYLPQQPHARRTLTLPVWLMTILFAVGVAGVVFAVVTLLSSNKGSAGTGPAPTASVENPAARPGSKVSSVQKYIEISGVRFTSDLKKKTMVQFVLINHSPAEISGLAGNVTLWGSTKKSEEDAQGSFSFATNLGPMESKELTVPLTTKLKIYALADWQNITTDVQITAPVQ